MLKVGNLSLVVGTFALSVLGTFLTRGSILSSVHTFAQSLVGPLYLAFLTVVLLGGFGLIAWRREALRVESSFDKPRGAAPFFIPSAAPAPLLRLSLWGRGPLLPWRAASLSAELRRLQGPAW